MTGNVAYGDAITFGTRLQQSFPLSPVYMRTFTYASKKWRSLFHCWAGTWFYDDDKREFIRSVDTPINAYRMAKKLGLHSFEGVDPQALIAVLQADLTQNSGFRIALQGTGESQLVYSLREDPYLYRDNRYGRILVRLRNLINENRL